MRRPMGAGRPHWGLTDVASSQAHYGLGKALWPSITCPCAGRVNISLGITKPGFTHNYYPLSGKCDSTPTPNTYPVSTCDTDLGQN